ncbi:DUF5107 domain-containing protein [Nonomuraea sediminis]|uniref:DUF5107 domain-containing protein n=1 Tax=Nonomuraea sediminis TaxID=2835864 RepID=UPI001BDC62D2|nr:DUF5107 domain-containing protein [Nonomuraea sediminis]
MPGSTLEASLVRIRMSEPGTASLLPILHGTGPLASAEGTDLDTSYGQPHTLLPYHAQNGYARAPREVDCTAAILRNEWLVATFLPGLGGRLWSLVDRVTGEDLLYRPDVLQPANLALRNAWFPGGVEWNLGATGHWPLTCAPLFAGRVEGPAGTPVLRMWEFERMRRLVFRVDAWLPPGSRTLFVRPLLHNPHDEPVPVYWWSNIAVPESGGVRVLAPAESAYLLDYTGQVRTTAVPRRDDGYPARSALPTDTFFDIPRGRQPWIAAIGEQGTGLLHSSTARLRGRKLFQWGTGPGGRRWQRWLGGAGTYLEIQAGLARTQLEHLPLAPGDTWAWTESYGPVEVDAHGAWPQAVDAVAALVDDGRLSRADAEADVWAGKQPAELLATGSGWGALEVLAGGMPYDEATPFPHETLGDEQEPWSVMVRAGRLPVSDPPAATVTGPIWRKLLEGQEANWHALLQLGLARLADGDDEGARQAWQESADLRETPWSLRNLAHLDRDRAPDLLARAHRLLPGYRQLTAETLAALISAGRAAEALRLVDELDPAQRANGRIRYYECRAAVEAGEIGRAAGLLAEGIEIDDLREGEDSLDTLWFAYQHAADSTEPLPERYDFRMHP